MKNPESRNIKSSPPSPHFAGEAKGPKNPRKKIVFITGTRADFSKIKSLMKAVESDPAFELFIFATGMHLHRNFGYTIEEIYKNGFKNIFQFINHDKHYQSEFALAATVEGFARYVAEIEPELIVVHGDRIEPLAAALVGALNNILIAHIEGGELSGTLDESLRHAISKLAHIHLVNDAQAKKRLLQLGESEGSIFIIGSPDLEILGEALPLNEAKKYYEIPFENYALVLFHPVTTELSSMREQTENLTAALRQSGDNFVVIYPNNDLGFELILQSYEPLSGLDNFRLFPSLRFEYFIALLRGADFIIGNSSCILKEAVFLGVPGILVGSRQRGRAGSEQVINVSANTGEILGAIKKIQSRVKIGGGDCGVGEAGAKMGGVAGVNLAGADSGGGVANTESGGVKGCGPESKKSSQLFLQFLKSGDFFKIPRQKIFHDRI